MTESTNERVLVVIDGDNFWEFIKVAQEPLEKIIDQYANRRSILVRPMMFLSIEGIDDSNFSTDGGQILFGYTADYYVYQTRKNNSIIQIETFNKHTPRQIKQFQNKGYPDLRVFIYILKNLNNFDTLMLFTGDGDFVEAAEYLKEEYGKETEFYHYTIEGQFANRNIRRYQKSINLEKHIKPQFR